MKYTQYFLQTRNRADRKRIKNEWIQGVITAPVRRTTQADGRIKVWGFIPEEKSISG